MKASLLNQAQSPSSPTIRIIKISPSKVDPAHYRLFSKKNEEENKTQAEASLKHWQSNKDISMNRIVKTEVENQ